MRMLGVITALAGMLATSANAATVDEVLPEGSAQIIVIPSILQAAGKLAIVERYKVATLTAPLEGFDDAHSWIESMVTQLGVDPRVSSSLESAGIDPKRELGIALMDDEKGSIVALPASDFEKVRARLSQIMDSRGWKVLRSKKKRDFEVVWFGDPQNPQVALLFARGYAIVADAKAAATVIGMANTGWKQSVASAGIFAVQRGRLPQGADAYLYTPASGVHRLGKSRKASLIASTVAAITVTAAAFRVSVDLRPNGFPELAAAFTEAKGARDDAPSGGIIRAVFRGEPKTIPPLLARLSEGEKRVPWMSADWKRFLGTLQPGVGISIRVADAATLGTYRPRNVVAATTLAGRASFVEGTNPKDELQRAAALGAKQGAHPKVTVDPDGKVTVSHPGADFGNTSAIARGADLFFGFPLSVVQAQSFAPAVTTDEALPAGALGLSLSISALIREVKRIPNRAFGVGGFAIRELVVKWAEAFDDFRAVKLSITRRKDAVQLTLAFEVR